MKSKTYRVKILGYQHVKPDALIDEMLTGVFYPDLEKQVCELVSKAINLQAFEMIIDIFEETEKPG